MLTYTGIGSRNTPDEILEKMFVIGEELAKAGWCLRSGYADALDEACAFANRLTAKQPSN